MTIFQLMDLIQTKNKAILLFQRIRWLNGIHCLKCGLIGKGIEKHRKTKGGFQKYRCLCGHVFSDTSDTVFHKRRTDVRHWLLALYELSQTKSITSVELGVKLGIPQRKAWGILNTLRGHCQYLIEPFCKLIMKGVAESDEAHYGKGKNSQMVQGVLQRKGHAVVYPIEDRTEKTLKGNIEKHVEKGSYVMTDTASAYGGLNCWGYKHYTLNHSKDEYSRGNGIHSNTMEGFWGNQKKLLYGIHHGVTKKRLFNYVNEYILKYNLKQGKNTFSSFLYLFISPPLTC